MLGRNDNLSVPLLKFSLLDGFLLSDHVIARDKHSLEELIFTESVYSFYLIYELRFIVFLGPIVFLL